jgi:hypothetical protein
MGFFVVFSGQTTSWVGPQVPPKFPICLPPPGILSPKKICGRKVEWGRRLLYHVQVGLPVANLERYVPPMHVASTQPDIDDILRRIGLEPLTLLLCSPTSAMLYLRLRPYRDLQDHRCDPHRQIEHVKG